MPKLSVLRVVDEMLVGTVQNYDILTALGCVRRWFAVLLGSAALFAQEYTVRTTENGNLVLSGQGKKLKKDDIVQFRLEKGGLNEQTYQIKDGDLTEDGELIATLAGMFAGDVITGVPQEAERMERERSHCGSRLPGSSESSEPAGLAPTET